MHTVVEVDDAKGHVFHCRKLGDLVWQPRISDRRGDCHQVDVGNASKILHYLREVVARNGVTQKQHIR
jgi:hypothetical protein